MNKIIYLLIGPNSWCRLEEASPNLSTHERSGFLAPSPFLSPDSKPKPALSALLLHSGAATWPTPNLSRIVAVHCNMRTGIHLLCTSQHRIPAYKYTLGYRRIEKSRIRNTSTPLLDLVLCHFLSVAAAMATSAVGALALCTPEVVGASQPCSSCASSRRQWNAGTSIGRRGLVSAVKSRRANCGVRAQVASSPVKNAMEYKKLGDSDLVISEVTLGTVRSSSVEFKKNKIYLFFYLFRWSESARVEWEHHKHLNSYIEFAFTLKQSHQTTSTFESMLTKHI